MGTSIFMYLLGFDYRLTWLVSSKNALPGAEKNLNRKLKILAMGEDRASLLHSPPVITSDPSALSDCSLVIEAITEDLEKKRALFGMLDRILDPDCILTTNSSSIIPSRLCPSEKRRENMAGLHFFFPVQLKNTVELIAGSGSSAGTISALAGFLHSINKKPFLQKENNPFILNRLLLEIQAEAYRILLEGKLTCSQIDGLVIEHLFSGGIFSFFDHVGIDVMRASILNYAELSSEKDRYTPLTDRMAELMASGRLGIKSKAGFYDYPAQPDSQLTIPVDGEYEALTIRRLERCFRQALDSFKASAEISEHEFLEALRDYLDLPSNPP